MDNKKDTSANTNFTVKIKRKMLDDTATGRGEYSPQNQPKEKKSTQTMCNSYMETATDINEDNDSKMSGTKSNSDAGNDASCPTQGASFRNVIMDNATKRQKCAHNSEQPQFPNNIFVGATTYQ